MNEIFDDAPSGYFSFFDDGTLHVVNNRICSLLGYSKHELEGKNVETIFTIATRIFYQTHLFPLVKMHGHAEEIFLSLQTKEKNHLPVLLNATRSQVNGKLYTACAFIVVVNRKKFEDELVAARKAAETALKENSELITARAELQKHTEQLDEQIQLVKKQNHELKQLNHVVTHSLREPLRKILLYSEKLEKDLSSLGIEKNIDKLVNASEQMRSIVSGLQQYVWLTDNSAEFIHTELGSLLANVTARLKNEFPDQLVLKTDELPTIKADSEQLELLFYHILSNAIKFKKGEAADVVLTASLIKQNRFRAVDNKYKYEDFVRLQFIDHGIGFDPVYKEEIFELFKKLHHAEGSGLGLALCKKVVENHFGVIAADSKINEGAVITVLLPIDPAAETS